MTNPDTGPFTLAYALSAVGFGVAFIGFCYVSVKLIDRWFTRRLDQHYDIAFGFDEIEQYANGEAHR